MNYPYSSDKYYVTNIKSLKYNSLAPFISSSKVDNYVVGSITKEPTIIKDLKFRNAAFEKCEKEKIPPHHPFFLININNIHNSSPSSCSSIDFNNIKIGDNNDRI